MKTNDAHEITEESRPSGPPKSRWISDVWNRPIMAGVVSGVIVLVAIQPILSLLWRFVLSNFRAFADLACKSASIGYTDKYGFSLLQLVFGVVVGVTVVGEVRSWNLTDRKLKPAAETVGTSIRTLPHLTTAVSFLSSMFKLFMVLYVLYFLMLLFVEMQMKASFYQRLAVISPKTSEQDQKEYLAEWANMRNEADYRRIVDRIENVAKENALSLPELLPGAGPME